MELFQGATLLATVAIPPYTFTVTNVQAGSYTFTARATDNRGGITTSDPVTVTVASGVAQLYFIYTDQLNTPRVITDQTNKVVWRWDNQDPFGGNVPDENPSSLGNFTCNLRLPGQYFDRETNTHYNYFRDYDPGTGRYVESDPIGLNGGINTYAYVRGNPIILVDRSGRFTILEVAIATGIGALIGYKAWQFVDSVDKAAEQIRQGNEASSNLLRDPFTSNADLQKLQRDEFRGIVDATIKGQELNDVVELPQRAEEASEFYKLVKKIKEFCK